MMMYKSLLKNKLWYLGSFVVLLMVILSVASCESHNEINAKSTFNTVESDEFIQFYKEFHTDTVFQLSHILFPLQGSSSTDVDHPNYRNGYVYYTKEEWVFHQLLAQNSQYKREWNELGENLVEELIIDVKNSFGLTRRFSKIDNKWYLIYYSGFSHIQIPSSSNL